MRTKHFLVGAARIGCLIKSGDQGNRPATEQWNSGYKNREPVDATANLLRCAHGSCPEHREVEYTPRGSLVPPAFSARPIDERIQETPLRILSPFSSVVRGMINRQDAVHYRIEAAKCHQAANRAKDSASRLHWEQAERCWLTLANQVEVSVNLLSGRNRVRSRNRLARLKNGQWE